MNQIYDTVVPVLTLVDEIVGTVNRITERK
jgi:hypothetical protein